MTEIKREDLVAAIGFDPLKDRQRREDYNAGIRAAVVRLRARATSEDVNTDRSPGLDAAFAARYAAQVLRDEADQLEKGL